MSILSEGAIKAALSSGAIRIACHYYKSGAAGVFEPRSSPSSQTPQQTAWLDGQISGVRVGLTLGPLLSTLSREAVPQALRYRQFDTVADIRGDKAYEMEPGESVAIFSNERLVLGPQYAAFAISRVISDGNGLTAKTSYINNGWDGLVQLRLKNESNKVIALRQGMNIAALFIHEVAGTNLQASDMGAPHRGKGWELIDDQLQPFTSALEKKPFVIQKETFSTSFRKFWTQQWERMVIAGGFLAVGGIASTALFQATTFLKKADDLDQERQSIATMQEEMERIPWSGTERVSFTAGQSELTFPVALPRAPNGDLVVFSDVLSVRPLDGQVEPTTEGFSPGQFLTSGGVAVQHGSKIAEIRVRRFGATLPPAEVTINYMVAEPHN